MKFNYAKLSFDSFLGHDEEYWDYEFTDNDNLKYNVIVTYDDVSEAWYGIAEVIDDESFIPLADLTDDQVKHCRELIPPGQLPPGQ